MVNRSCVGAKILTLAKLLAPCQVLLKLLATPSKVYTWYSVVKVKLYTKWSCVGVKISTLAKLLVPC